MQVHPRVAPLAFLLGTWEGKGKGIYPTIKSFEYKEVIRIGHSGKPMLSYSQQTWDLTTGTPLHSESGFIRCVSDDGKLEFLVSQPSGVISVEEGFVKEKEISFASTKVERTPTAKHPWVTSFSRKFWLNSSGELQYSFDMATENQPLQRHLDCTLTKKE